MLTRTARRLLADPPAPTGVTLTNVSSLQAASATITLDLPAPAENAKVLGYVFSLKYFPPTSPAPVDVVLSGTDDSAIAVHRSTISDFNSKLYLKMGLDTLQCGAGTGTPCGDGKYMLTAFAAASYDDDTGSTLPTGITGPSADPAGWKADAKLIAATLPTTTTFFVGEPGR